MNGEEIKSIESEHERERRLHGEWRKEVSGRNFKYERLTGTCEECIYFSEFSPHNRAYMGECKRHPPMYCADYLDHKPFYFPDVSSNDCCGEFKEAKKINKEREEW